MLFEDGKNEDPEEAGASFNGGYWAFRPKLNLKSVVGAERSFWSFFYWLKLKLGNIINVSLYYFVLKLLINYYNILIHEVLLS